MNQKYCPISVQFPQPGQRYSFKQSCQGNRFEAGGSGPCHVRMEKCAPFTYVKTSPEIIRQAATLRCVSRFRLETPKTCSMSAAPPLSSGAILALHEEQRPCPGGGRLELARHRRYPSVEGEEPSSLRPICLFSRCMRFGEHGRTGHQSRMSSA
ncbi:MAG: hypothetical protein M5U35_12830 [Roseovarius sp.]|nr:hypothetical protein [Roseovarius sp.]